MKKIVTLFLAVAALASAQAQTREEVRRVILGEGSSRQNPRQENGSSNPRDVVLGGDRGGSRNTSADGINREYDSKIYSIRNNPNLSQAEKERIIRQLERDRARRLNQVNGEYRNRGRDRDRDDDRYDRNRGDRGKHKGWNKGKGHQKNKHKGHDHD